MPSVGGLRITLATLIAFAALSATTWPLARSADAATLDAAEGDLQAQVNAFRAGRGLSTLAVSDTLTAAAKWMATDMSVQNYFAHTSLDGRTPAQRMADAGYPATATWTGEAIAAGTRGAPGSRRTSAPRARSTSRAPTSRTPGSAPRGPRRRRRRTSVPGRSAGSSSPSAPPRRRASTRSRSAASSTGRPGSRTPGCTGRSPSGSGLRRAHSPQKRLERFQERLWAIAVDEMAGARKAFHGEVAHRFLEAPLRVVVES